jgi:hypothetical protein
MDIKEFRQQHPEYDDMSDRALADALHRKHYSDMPKAQFDSKFLGGPSMEQGPPKWKRSVSDAAHTVLPAVGGTVGSIIGGGAGATGGTIAAPGPGTIAGVAVGAPAGGALGYGIGKQTARLVDQGLGLDPGRHIGEEARRAVGNVMDGIVGEGLGLGMGGLMSGAVPVAKAFGEGVRAVGRTVAPLSKQGAERVVRELLKKFERTGDAQFFQQAQAIERQVPGLKLTTGMARGNKDLISMERSVIAGGGTRPGMETVKSQADDLLQGNVRAIRDRTQQIAPGNVDDFTGELSRQRAGMDATRQRLSAADPQQTGQNVLDVVETAKEPVKAAMGRLGEAIPDYPMQFSRTGQAIKQIKDTKNLSPNQRQAVEAAERMIAEMQGKAGQSTMTAQGISRGLDEMISAAQGAPGREKAVPLLMQIKQAIGDDLAEVSQLAATGKMAVHKGKAVYPGQLAKELQDNLTELATLQSQSKPDIQAATAMLQERTGFPVMRMAGETEKAFAERVTREIQRSGLEMPVATGGNPQRLAALQQRNQEISDILQNVDPAQDVAAALGAYNKYASEQYFGRFDTPTMQNVQRTQRTENIGRQLANPSGVDDLVKAVGKPEARRIMQEHYHAEFAGLLDKNPNDVRLNQWLRSNAKTLGKAGLYDDFAKLVKEQKGYNEIAKILGSDPRSMFDTILAGNNRAQRQALLPILNRVKGNPRALAGLKRAFVEHLDGKLFKDLAADRQGFGNISKELQRMQPTIDLLFNESERRALQTVRKAAGLTQQLTASAPLGGSQTAELLQTGKRIIQGEKPNKILTGAMALLGFVATKDMGFGPQLAVGGSAAGAVSMWRNHIKEVGNERVRQYFVRAMFDPQYARTLVESTRYGVVPTHVQRQIRNQLGQLAGRSSFAALQATGRTE